MKTKIHFVIYRWI